MNHNWQLRRETKGCIWYDDVTKRKHCSRYWSFVRGFHRWPVHSPHKGQWCGALMFLLICAWIKGWINNREACDLRCQRAHYDVTVMPHNTDCQLDTPLKTRWRLMMMAPHWKLMMNLSLLKIKKVMAPNLLITSHGYVSVVRVPVLTNIGSPMTNLLHDRMVWNVICSRPSI